jgi:hypothetical protein
MFIQRWATDDAEGVEYDFYFTEYDFCPVWSRVLIFTHCSIKLIYLWDLLQKFGVKELRDFQQESVDNLLEGKDVYLTDCYLQYQRVSLS